MVASLPCVASRAPAAATSDYSRHCQKCNRSARPSMVFIGNDWGIDESTIECDKLCGLGKIAAAGFCPIEAYCNLPNCCANCCANAAYPLSISNCDCNLNERKWLR